MGLAKEKNSNIEVVGMKVLDKTVIRHGREARMLGGRKKQKYLLD